MLASYNASVAMVSEDDQCRPPDLSYHDHYVAKSTLGILYGLVFMTAVCGNTLVIYVVVTNKSMQSVTNLFIANLAVSDILVNFTSLWLTPVYSYLGRWVWGLAMCHLVPLFQGMSTFISALTLMAIAIDRYIAILHPFRSRTSLVICGTVVASIWLVGLLLVMPLAVQMNLYYDEECQLYICREEWVGFPEMRVVYGFVVLSLQFGVPFVVIAFCYVRIWIHLVYRRSMVATTARSSTDERRRGRLLKMLVAMVVIYVLAWLPVNSLNVLRDATHVDEKDYFVILFLFAHLCSMSATCWNPLLYAWMNENFRREFKAVLPCFKNLERINGRKQSFTTGGGRKSFHTAVVNTSEYSPSRPSVGIAVENSASIHSHSKAKWPRATETKIERRKLIVTEQNGHPPFTNQWLTIDSCYKGSATRHRTLSLTPPLCHTETAVLLNGPNRSRSDFQLSETGPIKNCSGICSDCKCDSNASSKFFSPASNSLTKEGGQLTNGQICRDNNDGEQIANNDLEIAPDLQLRGNELVAVFRSSY